MVDIGWRSPSNRPVPRASFQRGGTKAKSEDSQWPGRSARLASGYRSLGEAEYVGPLGVLGAASALVERELAVRVNLSLEAAKECFSRWTGASASVVGAVPRDLGCYPPVDVLGHEASRPLGATQRVCLSVCLSGRVRAFTCRRTREA